MNFYYAHQHAGVLLSSFVRFARTSVRHVAIVGDVTRGGGKDEIEAKKKKK